MRAERVSVVDAQGGLLGSGPVCQRMNLRSAYVPMGLRLCVTGRRHRAWAFWQRARALLWRLLPSYQQH